MTRTCAYPGCNRPALRTAVKGPDPKYCPGHRDRQNRGGGTAWTEPKRRRPHRTPTDIEFTDAMFEAILDYCAEREMTWKDFRLQLGPYGKKLWGSIDRRRDGRHTEVHRKAWRAFCDLAGLDPEEFKQQKDNEDDSATRYHIEVVCPNQEWVEVVLHAPERNHCALLGRFDGKRRFSDAHECVVSWSDTLGCEWDDMTPYGVEEEKTTEPEENGCNAEYKAVQHEYAGG